MNGRLRSSDVGIGGRFAEMPHLTNDTDDYQLAKYSGDCQIAQ
jgi:hypothetical protein